MLAMKETLRKQIILKRNALPEDEAAKKSRLIRQRLFLLPEYRDAKRICFYMSINSEVATREMIEQAMQDKQVFLPITNKKEHTLIIAEAKSLDDLKEGPYGVYEPKTDYVMAVNRAQIDLFIVPGVAFDSNCGRIGYGKGYYDKLLKGLSAVKIGLAYEFQIVDKIPREEHDVNVDIIVTEERAIDCKND
jgi:5-formyltetrahydrofolate cyclo-ligase